MPSLFRYFLVVGAALTGLLLLVNSWLAPDAAPVKAAAAVTPTIAVRHDPRASLVERLRAEQAAREAAARGGTAPAQVAVAPEPVVPVTEPTPTRPETPQIVAPVALVTPPAAQDSTADSRQAERIRAAQGRKARLARENARARRQQQQEEAASRQQDQFFYGSPRSAYAGGPSYGPFGGRTW